MCPDVGHQDWMFSRHQLVSLARATALSMILPPSNECCYETGLSAQVDQLLEYHFEEDMTRLTQHCGKKLTGGRQTIIVSATLKQDVSAFSKKHVVHFSSSQHAPNWPFVC